MLDWSVARSFLRSRCALWQHLLLMPPLINCHMMRTSLPCAAGAFTSAGGDCFCVSWASSRNALLCAKRIIAFFWPRPFTPTSRVSSLQLSPFLQRTRHTGAAAGKRHFNGSGSYFDDRTRLSCNPPLYCRLLGAWLPATALPPLPMMTASVLPS
jgi:hypothetical protein